MTDTQVMYNLCHFHDQEMHPCMKCKFIFYHVYFNLQYTCMNHARGGGGLYVVSTDADMGMFFP